MAFYIGMSSDRISFHLHFWGWSMIFQINLLTAVMNDAPVLPDEDDEVERYKSIYAIHQYVMLMDIYICKIQSLHLQILIKLLIKLDQIFTQDAIPMLTDSPQCLCFGIFVIWWDKNLLSKRVSNILSILVFMLMMMLKVNVHVQSFGQSFKIRQRLSLLCFLLASKSGIFNIF